MSFTVRNARISDATILFEMIETFHKETNIRHRPFTNATEKFVEEAFKKDANINFFITEFNGNILGYCAYSFSYNIIKGSYLIVNEVFVKKDYRNIGVSVFLFSKLIDKAFESNSFLIKWVIDLTDKKIVEIDEKVGVVINRDLLILNIYKEDIKFYLQNTYPKPSYEVRLAQAIDLPQFYDCIENLSKALNIKMQTDIYKLMKDGFSTNSKFKVIIALDGSEVLGFMSFVEAYNTFSGKGLIADQVFIRKDRRKQGIAKILLSELFHYAYTNNFEKVETTISRYNVETIERLKEVNVFPYENLRVAHYIKEEYKKLYKK